jgi:hypothetical protein
MGSQSPKIVEVELARVQRALQRVEATLGHDDEDYELLKDLAQSYQLLLQLVRQRGTTIARLRRLAGFVNSEKTADVLESQQGTGNQDPGGGADGEAAATATDNDTSGTPPPARKKRRKKAKGHGRLPASAYPNAQHVAVPHPDLRVGDRCPSCGRGKLYRLSEPARFLRIVGQAPLVAVCYDCERLRCGGCGTVFTAPAPQEARGPKYSETAVSMMALLRYGAGMPLNRLDQLQSALQTPVPSSTQWDVVNESASVFKPVHQAMERRAAQGRVVHNDDTYVRILALMGKRRAKLLARGELEDPERTGLFTTAVLSVTDDKLPIALFYSGRKHAGENLAELLEKREPGRAPPIQMSDALSRNVPKDHVVVESNCLAHGRRQVVDEVDNFPAECRHVLEELRKVYKVDDLCRQRGLSDDERLLCHQRESAKVMEELEKWMQAQFDDKRIEPNSGLGEAFNYMLKRWDKLTLFLRVAGAPLDNNVVELSLKRAIRHRNNSLFYRSERGAEVGDMFMSLIYTAELHGENPFDYLTTLQVHADAVADNPDAWLPWTYRATVAALEAQAQYAA